MPARCVMSYKVTCYLERRKQWNMDMRFGTWTVKHPVSQSY